ALAAWVSTDPSVRLAAAVLLAPFVVDLVWGGIHLPPLNLVIMRRRTETGAPFEETLRLENAAPARGVADVPLREPRTETYAGGVFVPRLPPSQHVTLPMPARTRLRGRYPQRVVVATSSHPLGLFHRTQVLRSNNEMVSEPTRMRLPTHVPEALERPQAEALSRDERGDEEFHHMREYSAGEDARLVHALRSATSGTLVRRVLRCQQQPEACIVLDLRRPPGRTARLGSRRLEWSLGATANLIDRMRARGTVVTVLVLGSEERQITIKNDGEAADFLAFLAEARATVHWQVSPETLERLGNIEQCLWVPAGGFKATQDRALMGNPVLVTEWEVL
ncbi:MAG: DUF58 domain-containing protein, partial [Planctomycetota bacterium]